MKSKIWIYFLFLLSFNQIKSQTIVFNRPQITFIYSNTSNPKNQNIEEYLNYIINNKIKSSINEILDIRYPGENNSQLRDYLRYYDFYENQLPIFNQIENNMINNPIVNFSYDDLSIEKRKTKLFPIVNEIFNFMFNRDNQGRLNLDRFYSRVITNAKPYDNALAENVFRGKKIITDDILKLTNQIYIAHLEYSDWKNKTFIETKAKASIYRVDFSNFIDRADFWQNFNSNFVGNVLKEEDFKLYYIGSRKIQSNVKSIKPKNQIFNSLYYQDLEQFFNQFN